MEIFNKEYLKDLIEHSKQSLNQTFCFHKDNFSKFDTVNSFLIDKVLKSDRTNILITSPTKDKLNDFLLPTILITSLHCLTKNSNSETELSVSDILVSKEDGRVSTVKDVNETSIRILPLGTTRRIDIENLSNYVQISPRYADRLEEVRFSKTRINNFEATKRKEITEYGSVLSYFNTTDIQLPLKNKTKVIFVASKNEILPKIPSCIPYQYVNKSGEVYPDTPFDPLLIVVNDFNTAKEFFIEKGIPIDTIVFIGDTKYQQSISAISKAYRQQKFNRSIFIGTQDIEIGENFEVLKWNWTLPEIKFFNQQQYQNLTPEIISNADLSEATLKFTNFISETERRYENLINLKRLLKFIRKVYPITAIGNVNRIRERANEIYAAFETEAEEVFQDEYYNIDTDYKEDFEQLKSITKNIIDLIKNGNAKNDWFKKATGIDYIVVPKSIKKHCEKEIQNCFSSKQKGITLNSLGNIAELLNQPKQDVNGDYAGLKDTPIITVSEFLKKEPDGKTHLLLSLYSNGIYTDVLLQKILAGNQKTKILCYAEEAKVLQMYLQGFQREDETELRSVHREQLCGIKYPETPNINTENIDEWIKHLIGLDEQKYTRADEQRYEIVFDDESKTVERESKKVFVDEYEELYKEINQLKKGDKVRIYRNPDKETLHDIIKMTDEKDLFTRVDNFSSLWKNALRSHFSNKGADYHFEMFFEELKENGLSVDKPRLEYWLKEDCKTKFPMKKRDLLAIIKTTNHSELNGNIQNIFALKTTYSGRLVKAGVEFSEEINTYILTKEKGKMLDWLSDEHIEHIVSNGAPLRTIKTIQLIDEEIID
ncbi:MAG: hypothetical protein Q7U77_05435 [Sediminibacterium sp.]|uniref:hypothetical protein n=1 Tax=Sediminibacterium sp. TaxID=1917865 RepID=UPI002727CF9F|nr:hypothetical protein [Sediminibacterium sp.]MDO8996048.1 hypothetical protein [Sediminibacterium sp.]